jgi:butyrate kinase
MQFDYKTFRVKISLCHNGTTYSVHIAIYHRQDDIWSIELAHQISNLPDFAGELEAIEHAQKSAILWVNRSVH